MTSKSTVNFDYFPVPGIEIGTGCAGIKKNNHTDVVVFKLAEKTNTAAVFTQNAFCAAPVIVAKQHLAVDKPLYLLVNTGNANAGTGKRGLDDALSCCKVLADNADCLPQQILPFSTGVIGEYLPTDKITHAIPDVLNNLSGNHWAQAAKGILTTDTVVKGSTRKLNFHGNEITISGIAKGSGMIRPDMATMLAYIATDAEIDLAVLQVCLQKSVNKSFNRITVDGDTSTNDCAVLMATGESGVVINDNSEELELFQEAVTEVCEELAKAIIRDGEGATKLITINVLGAKNQNEAINVAYTVAHSPLVKTAFFASDPNWGRILAAVGRAKVDNMDLDKIYIYLDDVCIVSQGGKATDYTEEKGQKVMEQSEISININLGRGEEQTCVWTCDFSYDYVRINAEYRT